MVLFSTSNFYTWSIPEMNSVRQADFNGGLHFLGGQLVEEMKYAG
jgi:hypothetical protein